MQNVLKMKENLRVLTVKSTFLRKISPVFLASGSVQDGNPLDNLWSGYWMSGSLNNGFQVVWICEHSFLSPLGSN